MTNLSKPIFFILLTSYLLSFNVAHAKWEKDTKDCKVWIDDKTTGQAPSWSGRCRGGFASGKGKVTYHYSSATQVKSCTGTMKKGKIQGYANCLFKSGDSFSGVIKNDQVVGRAVFKWKPRKNCKNCPRQYNGTFHNGVFAKGTLILANGQKVPVKYQPTRKGCLVWNQNPIHNEVLTWSGACKGGYANGRGILKSFSQKKTETVRAILKNGMIEGHAVVETKTKSACKNCVVRYEGQFKFNRPIKGVATLANGRKVKHNAQVQEMKKIASDSIKFQLAVMKIKRQMAMSRAVTDVSLTASCYMNPNCAVRYRYVPTY